MNITLKERFKLYYQLTFSKNILSIFAIPFFIIVSLILFKKEYNISTLLDYFYIYLAMVMFFLFICIIIHIRDLNYLFRNNLSIAEGKIHKIRYDNADDSSTGDIPSSGSYSYKSKSITLCTGNVIESRGNNGGGSYRVKIQTLDNKYTTPWIKIGHIVAKNKDNYTFKVIVYKNEAITCLYEKKK